MSQRALTFPTKRLASPLSSTGLVLLVNNIEHWDGNAIVAAEVGTLMYAALRNEANTQLEIIEIDASTIALGASTGATITKRALGYTGGTSVNAETAYAWNANETLVELGTDLPQLFENLMDLDEDQTVGGKKTFSTVPASTSDAAAANDLVRLSQLQAAALGSLAVTPVVVPGTAGETIAIDQVVYRKVSDGRWWLCDADTAATVDDIVLGISRGAGTAGVAITSGVTVFGEHAAASAIFTANTKYFISNTAGGFSTSAGTTNVALGMSRTTSTFLLYPRYDILITRNQSDALAGSSGTPSSTNVFVTKGDPSMPIYVATVVGTDAYAATPSPAPALTNGLAIRLKIDVANTGPATFNYAAGGALAIVKGISTALVTGDMSANSIITLVYNSTGTVWQLQNVPEQLVNGSVITDQHFHKRTVVVSSRDLSTASGNQSIAHGLGVAPKWVRIVARSMLGSNGNVAGWSDGSWDGTNGRSVYSANHNGGASSIAGSDSSNIISIMDTAVSTLQVASVTVDATNVILAWTKGGSATGTAVLLIESGV